MPVITPPILNLRFFNPDREGDIEDIMINFPLTYDGLRTCCRDDDAFTRQAWEYFEDLVYEPIEAEGVDDVNAAANWLVSVVPDLRQELMGAPFADDDEDDDAEDVQQPTQIFTATRGDEDPCDEDPCAPAA